MQCAIVVLHHGADAGQTDTPSPFREPVTVPGMATHLAAPPSRATDLVRAWVESLPPRQWFHLREVPGQAEEARAVLGLLSEGDAPLVSREAEDIYWRRTNSRLDYTCPPLLIGHAKSVLAPPGSSYATYNALHYLSWSTQVPCRTTMAVPYMGLTPPGLPEACPVQYEERTNLRRRELNWNEANLLEAAKYSIYGDYLDWDYAMCTFRLWNGWMKPDVPLRKKVFLWAAETEPDVDDGCDYGDCWRSFPRTLERLRRDLPETVVWSPRPAASS